MLETINSPEDLKKLSLDQVRDLAGQIRDLLIRTVAVTGGHLASNLGVVELTLALHRVFDSPRDKIIFDVGHQCYVHKLVTGRSGALGTLRQYGGLSGFPKRAESQHDCFETGHSSTSISAALGMALARDGNGDDYEVIAVIGDGSMTGGMAFEALNHAGHLGTKLIVVLNDNSMSISKNVGGLARHLGKLRTSPTYHRFKGDVEAALLRVPRIGPGLARWTRRIKDSVKHVFVPGTLFEALGFTYLGPIDGHDQALLEQVFAWARRLGGPVLVHVATRKGRGYQPAEENPDVFHGISPFDPETGTPLISEQTPTYSEVFGQAMVELAATHRHLVAITAAMTDGTGLLEFARRYPDRLYDVGIAEQHAVTLAAGLASAGIRPVVAVYATFLQRGYDQVLHDVCLQNLPVVFALDRAGLVGGDGATHHGLYDFAYLRHLPNITIMAPRDEQSLRQMLATALGLAGPVAVRYPRGRGPGAPLGPLETIEPGTGEVLRPGRHVSLIAIGTMVAHALGAADLLRARGIQAEVIDARFVKPLDARLITTSARRTGRVITIEEHVVPGGFGSAVAELLSDRGLLSSGVRLARLGIPDEVVEHGSNQSYFERFGLTPEGIARVAWDLMDRGGTSGETAAGQVLGE